jgi:hypothetical protein
MTEIARRRFNQVRSGRRRGVCCGAMAFGSPSRGCRGTLLPGGIPKYREKLVIPPATLTSTIQTTPSTTTRPRLGSSSSRSCPGGWPRTTVWSYRWCDRRGDAQQPGVHGRGDRGRAGAGEVDQWPAGFGRQLTCRISCPSTPRCTGVSRWVRTAGVTCARASTSPPERHPPPRGHSCEENDGYAEPWCLPPATTPGGSTPWGHRDGRRLVRLRPDACNRLSIG